MQPSQPPHEHFSSHGSVLRAQKGRQRGEADAGGEGDGPVFRVQCTPASTPGQCFATHLAIHKGAVSFAGRGGAVRESRRT